MAGRVRLSTGNNRFKSFPSHGTGASVGDHQIVIFFIHHLDDNVHGIIADPAAGFKADSAGQLAMDVLIKGLADLMCKGLKRG